MRKNYPKIINALIVFCLLITGCVLPDKSAPINAANYRETIRVACVGDSITYGNSIKYRLRDCYPAQLGRLLGDKWQTRNFGVSGATLLKKGDKPYWRQQAFKDVQAFNPHVVIIKLGTNDTKPPNWKFKGEFVSDYEDMIDRFAGLPAKPHIWICRPVPAYPARWGITNEIIKNGVLPLTDQIASEKDVGLINLYEPLSGKPQHFPDKIHPNAEGAALMAKVIYKAITSSKESDVRKTSAIPEVSIVDKSPFTDKKTDWNGYEKYDFVVDGRKCFVIVPYVTAPGRPWIWRARFFDIEPQTDIALLRKGFHLAYMDVTEMYGSPGAVAHWNKFYYYLTQKHNLAGKVALECLSRGGLIVYNWATANPEKVACIYADAPVCDFKSWPGGKGSSEGCSGCWQRCLKAYGFTEDQALAYKHNPIDNLKPLAQAGVPLLHVCGDSDKTVPMEENTDILVERYKKLGGHIQTIIKKGIGHNPHSLKDPTKIVRFISKHTALAGKPIFALRDDLANCRLQFKRNKTGRVAFLGGSITNMNGWRSQVAQMLQKRFPDTKFDFINAGTSSTDSTLGAFRLQNDVFSRGPVDLLFVEFAVNDQHNRRTATERIRGIEGIIRQARRKDPFIDIVLLYCADPIKYEQFNSGHTPPEIQSHETVARYYGIPSINLAREVFERMNTGEFTWKTFGGLHPGKFGHRLYAEAIERFCNAAWSRQSASDNYPSAHYLPLAPLDRYNYSRGCYIEPERAQITKGWQLLPLWNTDQGATRRRFRDIPMLVARRPDAILRLKFNGTAVGLLVVAGPDAGILEYRIDGGELRRLDQFTQWSPKLHIPWAYMLATELTDGEHELTLRTADKKNPDSIGHAARIVKFLGTFGTF